MQEEADILQHLRQSGLSRKHVGQQYCCYEERTDVAPAAHRAILQCICSDTSSWFYASSFIDNAAYRQTEETVCAFPASELCLPMQARATQKYVLHS